MLFMYKLHENTGWYASYRFQRNCRSLTCYSDDKNSTTPCIIHVFCEGELTAWFLNNKDKWRNRSTGSSCWSCFIIKAFLRFFKNVWYIPVTNSRPELKTKFSFIFSFKSTLWAVERFSSKIYISCYLNMNLYHVTFYILRL